jgi:RimJ/RimL family protein N-acetyltransferase
MFITGTAFAGKSTMVAMLAEKYGLIQCGENYHAKVADEIIVPERQPNLCYFQTMKDWQEFVNRTPEEYEKWIQAPTIYIRTERLYIRPFEEKDFQQFQILLDLWSYWQLQKNNARQFFEWHLSNYKKMDIEHGHVCFGIFLKESDALIGTISLNEHDDLHVPEMGYGILEDYRGKGYVKEASKAILTWAKSYFNIPYLVGTAEVSNLASQKVLEYCGFELIGVKNLEVHCMHERYDFMTYRFDF